MFHPLKPQCLIGPRGPTGNILHCLISPPLGNYCDMMKSTMNVSLLSYDFSISGIHMAFGAGQSGVWERKVLLRPKAQQCLGFDQWVSSSKPHLATWLEMSQECPSLSPFQFTQFVPMALSVTLTLPEAMSPVYAYFYLPLLQMATSFIPIFWGATFKCLYCLTSV